MKDEPGTLFISLDHESKTYPLNKFESMSEFFCKHGMSMLGAQVNWFGICDRKEGYFVWFFDMIMCNVTSS